jgi:type VI secretion system protein ImpL
MTKRKILWLAIIFILYEVLVWGFSLVVLADNAILIGSVLTICGLTLLGVYILVSKLAARSAAPAGAPPQAAQTPPPQSGPPAGAPPIPREESDAMASLIAEANARLAQSPRLASQRVRSTVADFPVYLMFGSEGSGKTSFFLASGLDVESIAGQVQRDSAVVPTGLANIWFAGNSIVVEAGGQFSGDPGRWARFLELFGPARNRSAMSKVFASEGRSNVRAVIFCVDISSFIGIPDASRQAAMAQRAQQQLRKVAETLGADFPVYVVFTKADMITFFADYFARMTDAEDQQIFGCTLAPVAPAQFGSSDQYTAAEGARYTNALNNLYVSLADKRLRFLERETDRKKKPAIYEFPREVRRIRAPLVQFLVDVFRPNPLQPNPSLRGFYFTGTRRVAAAGASEQTPIGATGIHRVGEVTRIFRPEEFRMAPEMPSGGGQEQLITRWAFASDLWRSLLRSGQNAIAPVAVNRRDESLRKIIFGSVAAVFALLFLLFGVSWVRNRSLLGDVQTAAAACEPLPPHSIASLKYLQEIDHLRDKLELLVDYDESHPPLSMRLGLYSGSRVLDAARHLYFTRFREYFLNDAVQRMETGLGGLPAAQTEAHPYQEVYGDLKIYRTITRSRSEGACAPDAALVEGLMGRWRGDRTLDGESEKIARANFEFFASSLKRKAIPEELLIESKDQPVVKHARDYLTAFKGIQPQYHAIIEQVNQELPTTAKLADLTHNTRYRSALRVADQVDSSFTVNGWAKVQQMIENAAQGRGSDSCVLGGGGLGSRIASFTGGSDVKRQLRELYINDYVRRWSDFVGKASTLPYSGCGDASDKLELLKDSFSPILAVLLMTAENTTFPKSSPSLGDEAKKAAVGAVKKGFLQRLPFGGGSNKAVQQKVNEAAPEDAPALTQDFITQTFQPARAVFEKPNREHWNDKRNDQYLNALGELQRAVQALNRGGKCDEGDVAANNLANQQMLKALDSVTTLSRSFDNAGVYDAVKAFLESPIRGVKPLIMTDPAEVSKRKLNSGQAGLCSQINALRNKKPFNSQSGDEVTLDQMSAIFAPQGGSFGNLRQLIGEQLVKSGATWSPKPDATLKLSRQFLTFFNQMSSISDALYQGGPKPAMHYKLVVKPNPGVKRVKGILDGDIFDMGEKQYNWPTAKPGIDLRVEQSTGGDNPLRGYPGNWGIFQMLSGADQRLSSNQFGLKFLQGGSGSLQQSILPDGSPIVIEVIEFPNGVQHAFDKDFFRLSCPVKATED